MHWIDMRVNRYVKKNSGYIHTKTEQTHSELLSFHVTMLLYCIAMMELPLQMTS